jgi:hypothetical protein
VILFCDPWARPFGFPLWPGLNGIVDSLLFAMASKAGFEPATFVSGTMLLLLNCRGIGWRWGSALGVA